VIRARHIMAVVGALVVALVAASCLTQGTPCTPADTVMAAHGLECAARVRACKGEPTCRAAVIKECDAWGEARCSHPDAGPEGGEGGAP